MFLKQVKTRYQIVADLSEEMSGIDEDYGIEDGSSTSKPFAKEVKMLANEAVDDIIKVLPWKKKDIKIVLVKKSDKMGWHRSETEGSPIILLSPKGIFQTLEKDDVDLDTAVMSTVWHELGHAVIELAQALQVAPKLLPKSSHQEEDWVEKFAHQWWKTGDVFPKMKAILEAMK